MGCTIFFILKLKFNSFFFKWRSNSCIGINSSPFLFLFFFDLFQFNWKINHFSGCLQFNDKIDWIGPLGNTYTVRSPTQSVTYDTTLFVFVAQNNINYIICLFWKSVVGFLLKVRTQKSEKWKTPWRRFEPWSQDVRHVYASLPREEPNVLWWKTHM